MFKTERQKQIAQVLLTLTGLLGFIFLLYARSTVFISDTAWHIKVGEWIVNNKAFPKYDSFSLLSSSVDLNFMAHEWLFGVLVHGIDSLFSLNGLFIMTILVVLGSYIVSIFKSKAIIPALAVSILFIFFQFSGSIVCRPSVFTAIVIVLLGYVFAFESKNLKRNIIIGVAMLFLANFHGGYSTIVLVQMLWILICKSIKNKKFDKYLCFTFSIAFIASCINPYGLNVHSYILTSSGSAALYNSDYLPLSFKSVAQIGVVLLVVILSIIGYVKKKDKDVLDLLIMFMYVVMLLRYKRTLDLFNYAFIIYMSKYLSWLFEKNIVKKICIVFINIFSICLIFLVISHEKLPNQKTSDYIKEYIIGKGIVDKVSNERFYNTMGSGGYFIYLDEKPLIDSRTDVYIEEFGNPNLWELSYKALYSDTLMYNLVSKYNLKYLVLERNSLSSQVFYASDKWEVVEESQNYVLFEKIK